MKQETIELIAALLEVIPSDRNVGVNTTVDKNGEVIHLTIMPSEKEGVELSPLEKPEGWVPIKVEEVHNHVGEKCRFLFRGEIVHGTIISTRPGNVHLINLEGYSHHHVESIELLNGKGGISRQVSDLQIKV